MSDYSRFKNHLHNTLRITKQDIRGMVQKSVDKVVERKMDVMFRDQYTVQRLVDDAIKRNLTWGNYWYESESKLDDYIKKEVINHLIKGIKLKVEVTGIRKKTNNE